MLLVALETHTESRAERNKWHLGYFVTAITSKGEGGKREMFKITFVPLVQKTYWQITYLYSGSRQHIYKSSSACLLLYNKMLLLKVQAVSRIVQCRLILWLTNAWFNQGMPRNKCRNQHSAWPYPSLAGAVLSQTQIQQEQLSGKRKKKEKKNIFIYPNFSNSFPIYLWK